MHPGKRRQWKTRYERSTPIIFVGLPTIGPRSASCKVSLVALESYFFLAPFELYLSESSEEACRTSC